MGTVVSALFWYVNDTEIGRYQFRISHDFPHSLTINPPVDGVTANATVVDASSGIDIDIISELYIREVLDLDNADIHCEGNSAQSNVIGIKVASEFATTLNINSAVWNTDL